MTTPLSTASWCATATLLMLTSDQMLQGAATLLASAAGAACCTVARHSYAWRCSVCLAVQAHSTTSIVQTPGMQNWQQQPSKQMVGLLKWLFQEISSLHGRGVAHGGLTLSTITCHPRDGWALCDSPVATNGMATGGSAGVVSTGGVEGADATSLAARKTKDTAALARIAAFLCLSFRDRQQYQPHHWKDLSDEKLLECCTHVPDVHMLAAALLRGAVSPADALTFHLWHPLAVHAQVCVPTLSDGFISVFKWLSKKQSVSESACLHMVSAGRAGKLPS
jgi:hypothetical protein